MSGMARLGIAQTRHQAEHGSACEIALAPYRGERKVDLVPAGCVSQTGNTLSRSLYMSTKGSQKD